MLLQKEKKSLRACYYKNHREGSHFSRQKHRLYVAFAPDRTKVSEGVTKMQIRTEQIGSPIAPKVEWPSCDLRTQANG
jgi:hypothetical protein